jgi:hypothetical protein
MPERRMICLARRAADRIRHGHAERGQRRVAAARVVIEIELVVGQLHDVGRPEVVHLRPGEGLLERREHVGEQRIRVVDAIGDQRPVHEVGGFGGRQMRAKHVLLGADLDDRRIVDRGVDEGDRRRRGRLRTKKKKTTRGR